MLSKKIFWGTLASLVLLTSTSAIVLAEMPASPSKQTIQSLEQPLVLKVGVTIGGLALIGLELWWFIFSKSQARQADIKTPELTQKD
jgi:plastocyanin domain-containing protein